MANIKQVNVSSATYDIEALHFITGTLDTPAQWKEYIDNLVGKGLQIVMDDWNTDHTAPKTQASATTLGKLYMCIYEQAKSGVYVEFVTINAGTPEVPIYAWEKIGTTEADLSDYVKTGTRTTSGPSTDATGSAGAQTATGTATITYAKSAAATGSTGSTATVNSGNAGGVTINGSNFTFTGKTQDISVDITKSTGASVASHTYTPAGTITHAADSTATVITSVGANGTAPVISGIYTSLAQKQAITVTTASCGATEKGTVGITDGSVSLTGTTTFNTDAIKDITLSASTISTDGPAYIESISGSAPSLGGTKTFVTGYSKFSGGSATGTFNTDAIKSIGGTKNYGFAASQATIATTIKTNNYGFATSTSDVMYSPTVTNGVLSWSTKAAGTTIAMNTVAASTQDAHTGTAASTAAVGWTAASLGTADTGTVSISGGSYSGVTKYMKHANTAATTASVGVSYTKQALNGTTTFVTSALKSASLEEDKSSSPRFSFNVDAINIAAGTGTVTVLTGVKATSTTVAVTSVGALGFSGTTATLSHTVTDAVYTGTFANASVEGTIGGSQTVAAHSHTYINLPAHTHAITLTNTSVTGTAAVAVSNHTHSLSGHTHSVVLNHTAA